jgi:hypothetical protein
MFTTFQKQDIHTFLRHYRATPHGVNDTKRKQKKMKEYVDLKRNTGIFDLGLLNIVSRGW